MSLVQRPASIVNALLRPLGLRLDRARPTTIAYGQVHDPRSSVAIDVELVESLLGELARVADEFFGASSMPNESSSAPGAGTLAEAADFWRTYVSRPFADNRGGSGFHNSFWLYLVTRRLAPSCIVESGVWKGQTTWFLEAASAGAETPPEVHGFDLNLGLLEHRSERANFYAHDWSEFDWSGIDIDRSRALAFFDCHVDHARRIAEAHERGFRHLVFDDNPPARHLYAYRIPGFPTAHMLADGVDSARREYRWKWQGEERRYELDPEVCERAARLIEAHEVFPDVGGFTRYGGFSYLTYVRLRDA